MTLYIPVAVLLVLFACVLGVSVFLRVSAVEVRGAARYSAEDVVRCAGINRGDNLLFIDIKDTENKLRSELPYVEKAEIRRRMPDTIVIELTESTPVAVVYAQGSGWIVDSKCRVLDTVMGQPPGLIRIDGITPIDPALGKQVSLGDIPGTRIEHLSDALKAIEAAGITGDVESVDVSNIANITFRYLGRFTVVLGSVEQAGSKLALLVETEAGLDADAEGKIILSVPGVARLESA